MRKYYKCKKYKDLEKDCYGHRITHIITPVSDDSTLCGFAIDSLVKDIPEDKVDDDTIPEITEEKMFTEKTEYGSNCKRCIGLLRVLRKIKK